MLPQLSPYTAPPAPRPLILIVDDVPENRFIVQRRLKRLGYDCILADGGPAALNMINTMSPHLILLDVVMPGMDGFTVLRQLRASPAHANLPVIMLTARIDGESVASALSEGADDYIVKPIDFTALKARIDASLIRRDRAIALAQANSRLDARTTIQAIELGEIRALLRGRFQQARFEEKARQAGQARLASSTSSHEPDAPALKEVVRRLRRIRDISTALQDSPNRRDVLPAMQEIDMQCACALNRLEMPGSDL